MIRIILQILAILILILGVTIITLRWDNRDADGPSILFPGGPLVSGDIHTGADPDWAFTDDVFTIELQLDDPLASRRIFIMESDGKIYVPSGYMRSFLGRIWKDWAFAADAGDGLAVARINGVRYGRTLVRTTDPATITGIATKMAQKYAGGVTPEVVASMEKSVADGDTWIFEMAPRSS
jgi:hypothetical protein